MTENHWLKFYRLIIFLVMIMMIFPGIGFVAEVSNGKRSGKGGIAEGEKHGNYHI